MSMTKDLVITISNEHEGTTLTIKTVSGLGREKVLISGDPTVYDIKEVEKALEEINLFHYQHNPKEEKKDWSKATEGYHLP